MSGYDRRRNYGDPVETDVVRSDDGLHRRGSYFGKEEVVVSYRDNPTGEYVADYTIDPYGWFLNKESALKRRMAALSGAFGADKPQIVDNGHPYDVQKRRFFTSHTHSSRIHPGSSSSLYTQGGPLWAYGARLSTLASIRAPFQPQATPGSASREIGTRIPSPSLDDLVSFGRDAFVDLAPARTRANITGMVGELLQGVPRVPFASISKWQGFARLGANEFLNFVFGVAPTIRDIATLVSALTHVSDQLLQLQRDAGAGVRRNMQTPRERSFVEFSGSDLEVPGSIVQGIPPYSFSGAPRSSGTAYAPYTSAYSSTLQVSADWSYRFSGSFSYYLPASSGFAASVAHYTALSEKLVSVRPTAEVIWNLTPFSWLVDWFVDVSDALRAAETASDDSLVLNYGYCSLDLTRRVRQSTRITRGSDSSLLPVHTTVELRQKTRLRANPYGFIDQNSADWTPIRFAILGAIGITGTPRI